MLSEPLEEMIYDDIWGVNVRFRDGEYDLTEAEAAAIRAYFDEVIAKAEKNGCVDVDDFKGFVGITEILEKADGGEAVLLCQYAYDKVMHIGCS